MGKEEDNIVAALGIIILGKLLWDALKKYRCPRCNYPVDNKDYICPNCGQPLDWGHL